MTENPELARLGRRLPPPAGPVATPPWEEARAVLDFDFPRDFREFVDCYGAGRVERKGSASLSVYGACSEPLQPDLPAGFHKYRQDLLQKVRPAFVFEGVDAAYWGGRMYPVYPDPGGLIAWGRSPDGDYFFWKPEHSDPDAWPVVMWDRGLGASYEFEGGMVAFLLALFDGGHPASPMVRGRGWQWTMTSDWLRNNLVLKGLPGD